MSETNTSLPERRFFGTDGIRGQAGRSPLTPDFLVALGRSAAAILGPGQDTDSRDWPTCVIGRDTRLSGDFIEAALGAGLAAGGVDVRLAGIVPTPAVAQLTRETGAAFGVVVSASHNPWQDNGVKFFAGDGYKLPDATEAAIEARILEFAAGKAGGPESLDEIGRISPLEDAAHRYEQHVLSLVHANDTLLSGVHIALDSANGAASETSRHVLEALGAKVTAAHDQPNGRNINRDCGCTHPTTIEQLVRESGATVGLAHDGDADRLLLCDETGSALDGDELMAIAAVDLLERGELSQDTLVATVMSNFGLDELVRSHGGSVLRTTVGDRYVVEALRQGAYSFGGEQSGHLIFHEHTTTGDGLVSAVHLLEVMQRRQQPLSELRKVLTKYPQAQRNIRVREKLPIEQIEPAALAIAETETKLGEAGRVLFRYSGTESLARLLIEGRDANYIESQADKIALAIESVIGTAK